MIHYALPDGDTGAVVGVSCDFCGGKHAIKVKDKSALLDWLRGNGNIQNKLPDLTAGEREILVTGMCEKCFDNTLKEED